MNMAKPSKAQDMIKEVVMNKRKGNIVAIALLALIISISGCITAFAEDSPSAVGGNLTDTITWSISDDVLTISGKGAMPNYNSPWENCSFGSVVIEEGVTCIGDRSFDSCTSLTNITIPNTAERIGSGAFSGCSKLTSISIPNSVKSIERSAFSSCSKLNSITIPDGITSIESGVFSNCSSLAKLVIPSSVTSIGETAFWYCSSLSEIEIPDSVESIGESAFNGCDGIKYFWIPDSVKSIGRYAFNGFGNKSAIFCEVPERPQGWNVDWTNFEVCYDSDYKEYQYWNKLNTENTTIIIPDGITVIPANAFSGCDKLSNVEIPSSVTSIGDSAFWGCSRIKYFWIPDNVNSIGRGAFGGSGSN